MSLDYLKIILPSLLKGTQVSLIVFVATLLLSLPLGLLISFGTMSRFAPLKWLAKLYVLVFRGTPLMLQLFFFYFFFPLFTPFAIGRLPAAVFTFVLNYAAYFSEIYRGGIESIDRGQREASKSLGFTPWQTMRLVIIPQAVRSVLPSVGNEIITLIKDTALVYVIGVPELMKATKDAASRDSNPTAYLAAAAIYLLLTIVLTFGLSRLEKRITRHVRKDKV